MYSIMYYLYEQKFCFLKVIKFYNIYNVLFDFYLIGFTNVKSMGCIHNLLHN